MLAVWRGEGGKTNPAKSHGAHCSSEMTATLESFALRDVDFFILSFSDPIPS